MDSQSRKLTANIATYTGVFLNVMLVLQPYLQFQTYILILMIRL